MPGYLSTAEFTALTLAPAVYVTEIETLQTGWVAGQLEYWSRWIDSQLAKRYAVPFADAPITVKGWLVNIVTLQCYLKRGIDATDNQIELIRQRDADTRAEIDKAANAVSGLFDLPMADGASGISKGTPLGYSEASPYTWRTLQRDAARDE